MHFENKFFTTERGERELFTKAADSEILYVPVTHDGFEALLERSCKEHDLPVDDSLRSVLCGFIHSMERNKCEFTIRECGFALRKSTCNAMTYLIDQTVKEEKRREIALRQAQDEQKRQEGLAQQRLAAADQKRERKAKGKKLSVDKA